MLLPPPLRVTVLPATKPRPRILSVRAVLSGAEAGGSPAAGSPAGGAPLPDLAACVAQAAHTDLADLDGVVHELSAERINTRNTHGTGCTLSSAIAVLRPGAADWLTTVGAAKAYLTGALRHADELMIGGTGTDHSTYDGHGPVHHFAAMWPGR